MAIAPFHVMTKPIGPICNLNCNYCFYLEKEGLYEKGERWKMQPEVLESYIRQYIQSQPADLPEISFAWQGGEPTLLGVEFFQKVIELQKKYSDGRKISNAIQTNGTLLDDEWCGFLAANAFLVGLSVDGPKHLHDQLRVDKQGRGSFDQVMRGLSFLKKHGVEFNTLTVVNRINADHPLSVYQFLIETGSRFLQFIPLVERLPQAQVDHRKARKVQDLTQMPQFAPPPKAPAESGSAQSEEDLPVSGESVLPRQYGAFLNQIFDRWVQRDVGRIFVQLFDVALGNWLGVGSSLCVFAETCGDALAIEHNGDLYACDHYVYSDFRLGNIMDKSLGDMVQSPQQRKFGTDKRDTLPDYCRKCSVPFACNGECPKHRFLKTPDGEDGLNYLCAGYKLFFNHVNDAMQTMAGLLRSGRPAAEIMNLHRRPART